MKKFVFILVMLLFVVVSNASPPPDPAVSFSADTVFVIQDVPNVELYSTQAQEVAYNDIGNVVIFGRQQACLVNNICYLSAVKHFAYLGSIKGIYNHRTLLKPSGNYRRIKNMKHSNYGYPFTANRC